VVPSLEGETFIIEEVGADGRLEVGDDRMLGLRKKTPWPNKSMQSFAPFS
jgi:hypothetical protein